MPGPTNDDRIACLSPRERQVMTLLDAGLRPPEIAQSLQIGKETVHTHTKRALAKLGMTDRRAAARVVAAETPADAVTTAAVTRILGTVRAAALVLEDASSRGEINGIGQGHADLDMEGARGSAPSGHPPVARGDDPSPAGRDARGRAQAQPGGAPPRASADDHRRRGPVLLRALAFDQSALDELTAGQKLQAAGLVAGGVGLLAFLAAALGALIIVLQTFR